jgi:F0F1-type ATP synthase membrane subunit a
VRSPLVTIIPPSERHIFYLLLLLLFLSLILWESGRLNYFKETAKIRKKLLPNFISITHRSLVLLIGGLFFFVGISLIPLAVIGFHFPLFGIGTRFSIWISILLARNFFRSFQAKKELLGDGSLRLIWVLASVGIERISRGARAVTLGARIRVNIMIGGILHRVIGSRNRRWGLFGLSLFEILVVVIQSYVFTLLICLYRVELE